METLQVRDTTVARNKFQNAFQHICDCHAPLKTQRVRIRQCPWMTKEILISIYGREYAHKKYLKTKDENDCKTYKCIRNQVTSLIRNTKRTYYESQIDTNSNNPSEIWKIINYILPKKNKDYQHTYTPDQYNKYFCDVGSKKSDSFKSHKLNYPWIGPVSRYEFTLMPVTMEMVQKEL